ncbi:hypothetical protein [Tenacibaculum jejuense]|uniref:Probable lipoprotein. Putative ulvanlyase n=1 Tax=Tenacibaculum jejuense TaxID=584609 RepID=A0A238U7Y6_9FLAO|nr:hypothetical protein [Tenacibaculum jejuense]SNR15155.1 Probable lipoprotein precursor. Putative ulvanlyase [Tenacibaculum jejuense]
MKYQSIISIVSASMLLLACQNENELISAQEDNKLSTEETIDLYNRNSNLSNCNPGKKNMFTREVDIKNPVNDGKIDDRTCFSDYFETKEGNTTYGNYQIAENSNHFGSRLQPRMERSFPRSNKKNGSFVEFKGTVRILQVGNTTSSGNDGTYIAQAKGKHTGGVGSPDPAICLYLAKPIYGKDKKGRRTQVAFDIYREQINYRGGSGKNGRKLVKLTRIDKGRPTNFELKVGFRTKNGKKIQYANAVIGNKNFSWNIPQPQKGKESGIRYGAYRVKGGKARIQWANTSFKRVNK